MKKKLDKILLYIYRKLSYFCSSKIFNILIYNYSIDKSGKKTLEFYNKYYWYWMRRKDKQITFLYGASGQNAW